MSTKIVDVGSTVTLLIPLDTDEASYSASSVGLVVGVGRGDDQTVLAKFPGLPPICLEPGDYVEGLAAVS